MIITFPWLREHLNTKANEVKILEQLTNIGLEVESVKENLVAAQKLNLEVEKKLRRKHNIRKMSRKQKEVAEQISEIIIANEEPENWQESIEKYLDSRCKCIREITIK